MEDIKTILISGVSRGLGDLIVEGMEFGWECRQDGMENECKYSTDETLATTSAPLEEVINKLDGRPEGRIYLKYQGLRFTVSKYPDDYHDWPYLSVAAAKDQFSKHAENGQENVSTYLEIVEFILENVDVEFGFGTSDTGVGVVFGDELDPTDHLFWLNVLPADVDGISKVEQMRDALYRFERIGDVYLVVTRENPRYGGTESLQREETLAELLGRDLL